MSMRMSAVWLPVSDWARAKRFYHQVLGLAETRCNDETGWAAYAAGSVPVFIVRRPDLAGRGGGAVVTFDCPDLELLRERVAAAGCRVDDALQHSGELLIMTFYDPDGNRLEAAQIMQ
jgi:predicted enzyme related to lactoylglutathione lyase